MAGIKDRLIQYVLRGKDELSPAARKRAEALDRVRKEGDALHGALDKAKEARGLAASMTATARAEARAKELRTALAKDPGNAGLAAALRAAEGEAGRLHRVSPSLKRSSVSLVRRPMPPVSILSIWRVSSQLGRVIDPGGCGGWVVFLHGGDGTASTDPDPAGVTGGIA